MLNIYIESDQSEYWLSKSGIKNYTLFRNLHEWASNKSGTSVAMVELINYDDDILQQVEFLCDTAQHVLIFVHELIRDDWIRKFDLPNVTFFISGFLNYNLKHSKIYFYSYFFWSITDFYKSQPGFLQQLNNTHVTHMFDVLLGRQKPHRDIIFQELSHDANIVKYFPSEQDQDIRDYSKNHFDWPSCVPLPEEPVTMLVHPVTVNGVIVSIGQIIPVDIYNQTRYSIVAETQVENEFSFFTEKVAKPMLARRLFIVVSGQYYLRNLRKLGFRTFSGLVNESYDEIESWENRTRAACAEAQRVSTLDSNLVQSTIADIVEYNFNHLMNTPWQENLCQDIGSILLTV